MSDKFPSIVDKVCYGIGRQMGDQLVHEPFGKVNLDAIKAGLTDAVNKEPSQVPPEVIEAAFKSINEAIELKAQEGAKQIIADSEAYLAKNAEREEINVTDSGLQYEVLEAGNGDIPTQSNTIKAHYKGTLIDGTQFDSSYDRGEPSEFPVTGVIPGWTEALQLMPVGSKWRLHIPHELAYGVNGAGDMIPGGAALVFDIELIDITA